MDKIIESVLLGTIQGVTEFLPISSSAHLKIFPWLFNFTEISLTTTLYEFKEIDSSSISAYKAVVVILLIIISSPFVRKLFEDLKNKREAAKAEALAGKETN